MKVTVRSDLPETFIGFIDHIRRRPGDVFSLPDDKRRALLPGEKKLVDLNDEAAGTFKSIADSDGKIPAGFSFKWMLPVAAGTAERTSTAQQALDAKSNIIKTERAAARSAEPGNTADVL